MTLPAHSLPPGAIEAQSFAIIDAEIPEPRPFTGRAWEVARRLIHTSGDTALLSRLFLPDAAVAAGITALRAGATVFTDTRMVASGIPLRRLDPLGARVVCLPDLPGVAELAAKDNITRARAAMLLAAPRLAGSIVAIGNAPTALLTLLEFLDDGLRSPAPGPVLAPALIIGMPVGFVNAAESKDMLVQSPWPALAVLGRKGGSNLAAATVNALAILAGREV